MRDSADCPKGYRFAYGAATRKTLPSGVFTIFDAGSIEVFDGWLFGSIASGCLTIVGRERIPVSVVSKSL
jgi:hypothetical protein